MLNIEFQCGGMVILGLVAFFYLRLPKLKVKTMRIFGWVIAAAALTTASDIASVFAIYYADELSDTFVKAVCKIYLLFLMILIFSGFTYLCADVFKGSEKFGKITRVTGVVFVLTMAVTLFLPINYICENDGRTVYSYGPFTIAIYVFFGIMFLSMFGLTIIKKNTLQKRRRLAVRIWLAMWLAAALLQFFNSSLLIVSFAACVGVLIVFLMIENPEFSLDKTSGFFHASAMPRYLDEIYSDVGFSLINTRFDEEYTDFYECIDTITFVGNGEIYFILPNEEPGFALELISERLSKQDIYVCEDNSFAENAEELLRILGEAKSLIRKDTPTNVYFVNGDVKARLEEKKRAEILVRDAIENGTIEPFFQPIYSVKTGLFSSAEALARIRGRDGEIVSPWKFIPIAEENGDIIKLGKIMLERVCGFLKDTPDSGLDYIEVNLSVVQGQDMQLAEDIWAIMEKYNISSDRINLEITESASIHEREQLLENMNKLIQKGVKFSLDDFGTGHSNLDYMTVMPVSIVKFDRSMTQNYFVSEKTKYVMTAAVEMIHEMGMEVVVEGIETADQLSEMTELGADYIQGYYFSKPLPKDEFTAFLKEKNNCLSKK